MISEILYQFSHVNFGSEVPDGGLTPRVLGGFILEVGGAAVGMASGFTNSRVSLAILENTPCLDAHWK